MLLLCSLSFLTPVPAAAQTWSAYGATTHVLFLPSSLASLADDISSSLAAGFAVPGSCLGLTSPPIPVVIEDLGCRTSGLADPCFSVITLSSFSPGHPDLLDCCSDWWRMVGTHEYTHIAHLQTASGVIEPLHRIVGFPIMPNVFSPYFVHEGMAVLAESLGPAYEGRLNAGPFASWIDILSREDMIPDIAEAVYAPFGFPGKNGPYLLGSGFFEYLADTYGLSSVHDFVSTCGGSPSMFVAPLLPERTIDRVAVRVFGRSLPELWDDWKSSLGTSQVPARDFTLISSAGGVTGAPSLVGDCVIYGRNTRTKTAALRAWPDHEIVAYSIATGAETVVTRHNASIRGAIRSCLGAVYYLTDQLAPGFTNFSNQGYGYVCDLWKLDLETRKRSHLLCAPIRTFDVDNEGTIYYAEDRGAPFGSRIWRVRSDGEPHLVIELDELVLDIVVIGSRAVVIVKEYDSLPHAQSLDLTTGDCNSVLASFTSAAWLQTSGNAVTVAVQSGSESAVAYLDPASGVERVFPAVGYTEGAVYDNAQQLLYCAGPSLAGLDIVAMHTVPIPLPFSPGTTEPRSAGHVGSDMEAELNPLLCDLSFAWPSIRAPFLDPTTGDPGLLLVGRDALGMLSYAVLPNVDLEGLRFRCPIAFQALPTPQLRLQGSIGLTRENDLILSLDAPAYRSLATGIQTIHLGLSGRWLLDSGNALLVPKLTCRLGTPELVLSLDFALQLSLHPSDHEQAFPTVMARAQGRAPCDSGETAFSVSLWPGTLPLDVLGLFDFSPGMISLDPPRFGGWIERWLPLFEIDKGMWSPSIYVGGAFARLYAEAQVAEQQAHFSVGIDFVLEIGFLFRLYAAPGISISIDENLHPRIELVLRDLRDITQTY